MAGRETSGYGAADPDLFVGRPWIVCPDGETAAAIGVVERLAEAAGASPLRMAAADHDAAAAAISHLPLLVSAALVEAVLGGSGGQETQKGETSRTQASGTEAGLAAIRSLAASGWRDATRLAGGDPQMGAGIAVTNADELAARARALREVLDAWLVELERPGGPDADRIEARLATARSLLVAEPRVDGR